MPDFRFEDVEINYVKRGKGKPLVMLQGLGQSIGSWTFQIPYFKRKMMVIALDNRGVGMSSRPDYPYTIEMFVEETKALLDFLEIKEKIHLMGISMGGMIAQAFALKYPDLVKTVILLATSAKLDPSPLIDTYEGFQKMGTNEVYQKKMELMFSKDFIKKVADDEKLTDLLVKKMVTENTTTMQDYINRSAAIKNHDTRDSLVNLTQPTLILHGKADDIIPFEEAEFLHSKIPNSTLEALEDYGHGSLLVEDTDTINGLIWKFIEGHLD
jgi:pimeloyl-ACP methyl ester carboxylesterase